MDYYMTIDTSGDYMLHIRGFVVRTVLRAYTITIMLLIGLIGDQCCRLLVRRRLLHSHPVRLTHIIGWQRGFGPFSMFWYLRTIPGGALMGSLMIFTSLLAIVSDLATANMVRSALYRSKCLFEGGMVVALDDPPAMYPDVNGEATLWAINAQTWNLLGNWDCKYDIEDAVSFPQDTFMLEVIQNFIKSGKLYELGLEDQAQRFDEDTAPRNSNTYNQLFAWTASEQGSVMQYWGVRVLLDLTPPDDTHERFFNILHCTVSGPDEHGINNVLARVEVDYTLAAWAPVVQGAIYRGVGGELYYDDAPGIVATYLNSMVMVAASNQSVTRPGSKSNYIGCSLEGAVVPTPVIVLFFTSTALFLGICGCFLVLFVSCRISVRHGKNGEQHLSKYIPGSLIEWMAYALRESKIPAARDAMPKHLSGWDLTAVGGGGPHDTQFVKRGEPAYLPVV